MPLTKRMIVLGLLLIAGVSKAQQDNISAAFRYVESGKLDSAKLIIDQTVNNPKTANQARAWFMRGVVYKEIYKYREGNDKKSPAREESMKSFLKSLSLDSASDNQKSNKAYIKFLASKYYNDAAASLNMVSYKLAIENYEKYRKYILIADPLTDIKQRDIEFTMAIGSVYTKIFDSDRQNKTKFLELAKTSFSNVLDLDANNFSANKNMGLLYYNQSVHLIKELEYDIDIRSLDKVQNKSIDLFREALPFELKAHEIDPTDKEVIIALAGIYFSLNDFEKSNEFLKKLEEIERKK